MKALMANFSLGREVWDRVKSKFFSRDEAPAGISLELVEIPEPALIGPEWLKIRAVISGISDMDEGMVSHHDLSAFGPFLSFPFVPGNENMGIVTEAGKDAGDVELGQRVLVDPLLPCKPRGVNPPCPSCSRGEPSSCRSFGKGVIGPGIMIGACQDTGGGWGDYFVAHRSQVRPLPDAMESDHAALIPELTRAVKAVLRHPPSPGDRVIVVGAGSLGILTLKVLEIMTQGTRVLIAANYPHEEELARKLTGFDVVSTYGGLGSFYEEVAAFAAATVRYPEVGKIALEGGADLVYETTGTRESIDEALRLTGEGKKLVLMRLAQPPGFDAAPLWWKGVRIAALGLSGRESYKGTAVDVLDVALDLAVGGEMPFSDLLRHKFKRDEHRPAFAALENRAESKAFKVVFQNVV
jgi:threonine dehydrogenase-like Zn-dependent dehydrogenase